MASRRTHTKSRNGCQECKRRKVKCDESHPCCFNCARHGVICSLGIKNSNGSNGNASRASLTPGACCPPQFDYPTPAVSPSVAIGNLAQLLDNERAHAVSATNSELDGRALELMHHWCVYTAETVTFQYEAQQVWKVHVPEIGYRCRYVMHGIMAIAAMHKAILLPTQSGTYFDLAAYYQTLGLQGFLAEMHRIDHETWQQAFCFASTVSMYALCSPALRKREATLSPLDMTRDMFTYARGIRAIIIPCQGRIATTKLRAISTSLFVVDEKDPLFEHPRIEDSPLPPDTFEAFERLLAFGDRLPLARQGSYKSAVGYMTRVGYLVAHAGMQPEPGMVMYWTFELSDAVMDDISAGDPFALVLLAHFAVFFAVLESRVWFFRGWPKLIFRAIDDNLVDEDGSFVEAMAWARRQVFEVFACSSVR